MEQTETKSTGCCEPFNPDSWTDKELIWNEKLFIKDHVKSLFHIPLNMGKIVTKNMSLIEKANAKTPYQLMLSDELSPWGLDLYIDVSKEVPGVQMTYLSGTYLTKVFEGPYQNVGKWSEEMKRYVASINKTSKKLFISYTTCPNCAKVYGKNYVVLFAQIA